MFGNVRVATNFWKSSESGRKSSGNRQKHRYQYVYTAVSTKVVPHSSVKAWRHYRLVLWVVTVWRSIPWWRLTVFQERDSINTHAWAAFFCHAKTPWASIKQPHTTFRHCRVCFYAFVGQPFPKQLYNKQNVNTWLLVDIEYLFSCLTLYLTRSLHSLVVTR